MKREEHYCDVCGTKMTYLDADGDNCLNGIVLREKVAAHLDIRTTYGSTGSMQCLHGSEFCSFKCFSKRALDWVREVEKSA